MDSFVYNRLNFREIKSKCADKCGHVKTVESINLDNFTVLRCSGKMARPAAVEEDMQHDPIKGRIL